jgi:hypothetical protein
MGVQLGDVKHNITHGPAGTAWHVGLEPLGCSGGKQMGIGIEVGEVRVKRKHGGETTCQSSRRGVSCTD